MNFRKLQTLGKTPATSLLPSHDPLLEPALCLITVLQRQPSVPGGCNQDSRCRLVTLHHLSLISQLSFTFVYENSLIPVIKNEACPSLQPPSSPPPLHPTLPKGWTQFQLPGSLPTFFLPPCSFSFAVRGWGVGRKEVPSYKIGLQDCLACVPHTYRIGAAGGSCSLCAF